MLKPILFLALAAALLAAQCGSPAAEAETASQQESEAEPESYEPFELATMRLEQNATDGDMEVVFEVTGGDEGLTRLKVVSPGGDMLIDYTSHGDESMGIRKFILESPEPGDAGSLKMAFPEGAYQFTGIDTEDNGFKGESSLSHALPATASFLKPEPEAENVPVEGLVIQWEAPDGLSACIVEVEAEGEGQSAAIAATLPGTVRSFAVPDGFLQPGTEYKVAIGTVAEGGNRSFVETAFTTAGGQEEE